MVAFEVLGLQRPASSTATTLRRWLVPLWGPRFPPPCRPLLRLPSRPARVWCSKGKWWLQRDGQLVRRLYLCHLPRPTARRGKAFCSRGTSMRVSKKSEGGTSVHRRGRERANRCPSGEMQDGQTYNSSIGKTSSKAQTLHSPVYSHSFEHRLDIFYRSVSRHATALFELGKFFSLWLETGLRCLTARLSTPSNWNMEATVHRFFAGHANDWL